MRGRACWTLAGLSARRAEEMALAGVGRPGGGGGRTGSTQRSGERWRGGGARADVGWPDGRRALVCAVAEGGGRAAVSRTSRLWWCRREGGADPGVAKSGAPVGRASSTNIATPASSIAASATPTNTLRRCCGLRSPPATRGSRRRARQPADAFMRPSAVRRARPSTHCRRAARTKRPAQHRG